MSLARSQLELKPAFFPETFGEEAGFIFRLTAVASKTRNNDKITPKAGSNNITVSEAGRLGGLETLRRHGRQHFVTAGRCGQEVIARYYTTEDRRHWGSLGGRPKRLRLADMGKKGQSK